MSKVNQSERESDKIFPYFCDGFPVIALVILNVAVHWAASGSLHLKTAFIK